MEWFQVVMTFSDKLQRLEDLNLVAIRLRFKEYHCYPKLNSDGTADTSEWLIERKNHEPRVAVDSFSELHRSIRYYRKKYWHKVDPAKHELDLDPGIAEFYAKKGINLYAKNNVEEKEYEDNELLLSEETQSESKPKDEELIKMVEKLEARLIKRKRMEVAKQLDDVTET